MNVHPIKFLGMTKTQFLGVLMILLTLTFAAHAYTIRQTEALTARDVQAHAALCVLRADYVKRANDDRAFLHLTPAQREAKYGKALGDTPAAVVRQSEYNLRRSAVALDSLECR